MESVATLEGALEVAPVGCGRENRDSQWEGGNKKSLKYMLEGSPALDSSTLSTHFYVFALSLDREAPWDLSLPAL